MSAETGSFGAPVSDPREALIYVGIIDQTNADINNDPLGEMKQLTEISQQIHDQFVDLQTHDFEKGPIVVTVKGNEGATLFYGLKRLFVQHSRPETPAEVDDFRQIRSLTFKAVEYNMPAEDQLVPQAA